MDDHQYLWEKRSEVLYRVELSQLYHQKRERFFDLLDKTTKAVSIFGGSLAFSRLATPDVIVWAAAAITAASTLSLVAGWSDKSKRHAELVRNFCNLEQTIVGAGERDFTESDVAAWNAKERGLEASEPPALATLVVACQNELAAILGGERTPIPFWKRVTMNVVG